MLKSWCHKEPRHQQPWHWQCWTWIIWFPHVKLMHWILMKMAEILQKCPIFAQLHILLYQIQSLIMSFDLSHGTFNSLTPSDAIWSLRPQSIMFISHIHMGMVLEKLTNWTNIMIGDCQTHHVNSLWYHSDTKYHMQSFFSIWFIKCAAYVIIFTLNTL